MTADRSADVLDLIDGAIDDWTSEADADLVVAARIGRFNEMVGWRGTLIR